MDVILDLYTNGKQGEFILKLLEFNITNASAFTFVDRYGEETKSKFIQTLLKALHNSEDPILSSSQAMTAMLTAIRLCLREPIATGPIDAKENVHMIVQYSGITGNPTTSLDVQEEACKCLVNMVAKNKTIENMFVTELGGPLHIVKHLEEGVDLKLVFPLCRILFHISLQSAAAKQLIDAGAIKLMMKLINENITDNLSVLEGTPSAIILADAFKVIFNLTIRYGPLSGSGPQPVSEDELQLIHPLVPLFERVLVQSSTSEFVHQLKLTIVNCMINTPKGYMRALVDKEGKVIRALEGILSVQVESTKERPTEALTPILMLLTNIAEEVREVRDALKAFVFPKELLDSQNSGSITVEAPKELPTTAIGSKLIPHMTTVDVALKHYVNEFFYMICDENANEVCRLTGFGNAAGLLVMRGLMKLGDNSSSGTRSRSNSNASPVPPQQNPTSPPKALESPRKQSPQPQQQPLESPRRQQSQQPESPRRQQSPLESPRRQTQQQPVSPRSPQQPQPTPQPQPQPQPQQANPYARREGESDEDHAERLAEGLQKLMDSGVIQVVRNNKEG